jgi:hypothetical protein
VGWLYPLIYHEDPVFLSVCLSDDGGWEKDVNKCNHTLRCFGKYFQKKYFIRAPVLVRIWGIKRRCILGLFGFNICHFSFLLPQVNGGACVDFGCTRPIEMGCFEVYPSTCWFLLKIWMLGNWFNHDSIYIYLLLFLGCHLPFCITRFHITTKCIKTTHMTNFLNDFLK